MVPTLTTQELEDSSDEGDEVDMTHSTDTMTTLVTEPLQVVPDIVPGYEDCYSFSERTKL